MKKSESNFKVLYISSEDQSIGDGPGVNEREFVVNLHKLTGGNSTFLIPEMENEVPFDIPLKHTVFTRSHRKRSPFFWLIHQFSMLYNAHKLLSKNNVNLIVIRASVFAIGYLILTKWHRNIPYVLKTASDGQFRYFRSKSRFWQLLKGLNQKIYFSLVRNALLCDTVSDVHTESLTDLVKLNEGRIITIDNGVNTDRFYPKSLEDIRKKLNLDHFEYIIGYAGNAAEKRGGSQIIEVLPDLKKVFPGIGVVIMGNGISILEKRAKELNVENNCYFTGQISYDYVSDYINTFDVGISLIGPELRGASEQKVRQYLACGKPVIASPGSSSFIAKDGLGSIVRHNDITSLFIEIKRWLLLSENEKQAYQVKCVNYAKKYLSYEASVQKRLELWKSKIQ